MLTTGDPVTVTVTGTGQLLEPDDAPTGLLSTTPPLPATPLLVGLIVLIMVEVEVEVIVVVDSLSPPAPPVAPASLLEVA